MDEDEKAIREVIQRWMDATKSGDAATVLGLMTDDAVFMVPGQAPFGKEAFAAAQGGGGPSIEGRSDVLEVKVLGDWAFARARLEVIATPPGGAPVRRAGHALSLFRKEADGRWRLARDANLLAVQD